jgi:pilus assembly protein CpaC
VPQKLHKAGGLRVALKIALTVAAAVMLAAPGSLGDKARAQSAVEEQGGEVHRLRVIRNKSRTFEVTVPFAQAIVGSPEIADVLPVSDRVIYVQGKKVGTTNVSIFDKKKHIIGILDVEVTVDTRAVARRIHANIASKGITVSSSQEQLILGGHAKNAVDAEQAVQIAGSIEKDVKIVNLIQIDSAQQVLLKVRFLEANRTAERDLGFTWFAARGSGSRGALIGLGNIAAAAPALSTPLAAGAGILSSTSTPFAVGLANLASKGANVDLLISALETKGLVRIIAEPDLVALSGDTASFLAGGEVPVPVVQPSSSAQSIITVDYKKFGVQLTFMPTVLANGVINLRLNPSVSQLDYANGVTQNGYIIPALTSREAKTTIELRDGQSFAIAGLLQSEGLRNIDQMPWLGSVPVLGSLFRSSQYRQKETDLVVIVTPSLAAPAAPGQKLASPLDNRHPSNDADFFLNGQMEVPKQYTEFVSSGGDVSGPFGHSISIDGK